LAKAKNKPIKPAAKTESPLPAAIEKPPVKVEPSTTPLPKTKETEASGKKEGTKGWTIQVNAYPDERSAKLLVDRLKNKGYNAYATDVRIRGKVWYRVRVGSYASREEAEKVEETLKSKENHTRAFATSR
jgi:DedD protein